jgi:hypothetical protein
MELRLLKHGYMDDPNSWRCEDGLGYFYMVKLQMKETMDSSYGTITMWADVPLVEEL